MIEEKKPYNRVLLGQIEKDDAVLVLCQNLVKPVGGDGLGKGRGGRLDPGKYSGKCALPFIIPNIHTLVEAASVYAMTITSHALHLRKHTGDLSPLLFDGGKSSNAQRYGKLLFHGTIHGCDIDLVPELGGHLTQSRRERLAMRTPNIIRGCRK